MHGRTALASALVAGLCVAIAGAASAATARSRLLGQPVYAPDTFWSKPVPIEPLAGPLTGLSCGSSTACVAVDRNGLATVYDGTSWSLPTRIDAAGHPTGVACTSAGSCVVVDDEGNAIAYDGTWGAPRAVDPYGGGLVDVACASAAFCMALDQDGRALAEDAGTWGAATPVPSLDTTNEHGIYGGEKTLSCVSTTFCVVVAGTDAWTFDGAAWSAPTRTTTGYFNLTDVSCASSSLCVAFDQFGPTTVEWDGAAWHAVNLSVQATSVSCAAPSFCLITSDLGDATVLDASSTTQVREPSPSFVAETQPLAYLASCSSPTFCVVTDSIGYGATFDGTAFGPIQPVDPPNHLDAVACPSTTTCVAVDTAGDALTFDGTAWSEPTRVDPSGLQLVALSCPSATECEAMSVGGVAYAWNGSAWDGGTPIATTTPAAQLGLPALSDVACPTTTFCLAIGDGVTVTDTNGTWAAPVQDLQNFTQLSCSSATSCEATNGAYTYAYNGTKWAADLSFPGDFSRLTCTIPSRCYVVNERTSLYQLVNGHWKLVLSSHFGRLGALSCAATSFCALWTEGGRASTSAGPYFVPSVGVDPATANDNSYAGPHAGLSCPAVDVCMAVDSADDASLGSGAQPTITQLGTSAPARVPPARVITLVARVFGSVPGGTVTFFDHYANLVGCTGVTLTTTGVRTAVCRTRASTKVNRYYAAYSGDGRLFEPSVSSAVVIEAGR